MSLTVAMRMGPIETINIDADSTIVLAPEAQRRGHMLFHYQVANISLPPKRRSGMP